MNFNSLIFIYLFLPAAAAGFFLSGKHGRRAADGFLLAAGLVFYTFAGIPAALLLLAGVLGVMGALRVRTRSSRVFSDAVNGHRKLVETYALKERIPEEADALLAIMEIESGGRAEDVMQSSESLGLEPNSLGPEASIEQACSYYSQLLDIAEDQGCDEKSVIQAYNYGPGYLYYVASHGGKHSFDLAVSYAEEMSGGRTSAYTHEIADFNGNWMYLYGNMYYVKLVEQYLPD